MGPQLLLLLLQHLGTCSRNAKPLPRECSITSVQKTASWGTEMGEVCLGAITAQTGAKKLLSGELSINPALVPLVSSATHRASCAPLSTRSL